MVHDYNNLVRIIKRNGTRRIEGNNSIVHSITFTDPMETQYGQLFEIGYRQTFVGNRKINEFSLSFLNSKFEKITHTIKPTNYRWIYNIYRFLEEWGVMDDYQMR